MPIYTDENLPKQESWQLPQTQPTLRDQIAAAYTTPTGMPTAGNEFTRGLTSTALNIRASDFRQKQFEAMRAKNFALADEYKRQADDLEQQAYVNAPINQNFTDALESPSRLPGWAMGALGSMVPTVLPTLATGAAGAFGAGRLAKKFGLDQAKAQALGGWAGGTIPAYQMERNEAISEAMANPEIMANRSLDEIANAAMVKGGLAAGMEALVPAAAGGFMRGASKVLPRGVNRLAKGEVLPAAGTEFLTEGAQSLIGQSTQNYLEGKSLTDYDWTQALNEAAAGAVGGAGMAAPGALGRAGYNWAQGKYNSPEVQERVQAAREKLNLGEQKANEHMQKAAEAAAPVVDTLKQNAKDLTNFAEAKKAEYEEAKAAADTANAQVVRTTGEPATANTASADTQTATQDRVAQEAQQMGSEIVEYLRSANENKEPATRNTKTNIVSYKKRDAQGVIRTFNEQGVDITSGAIIDTEHPNWQQENLTEEQKTWSGILNNQSKRLKGVRQAWENSQNVESQQNFISKDEKNPTFQYLSAYGQELARRADGFLTQIERETLNRDPELFYEKYGDAVNQRAAFSPNELLSFRNTFSSYDRDIPANLFVKNKNQTTIANAFKENIKKFKSINAMHNQIYFVDNPVELLEDNPAFALKNINYLNNKQIDKRAALSYRKNGFFDKKSKKVIIFLANMKKNRESIFSTYLHEVGVHYGLESIIEPEKLNKLYAQIETWSKNALNKKTPLTLEEKISKDVMKFWEKEYRPRVENPNQIKNEILAIFVSMAIQNEKVLPQIYAMDKKEIKKSALLQLLKSILDSCRNFLKKLYVNTEALTTQEIVDFAWAAASKITDNEISMGSISQNSQDIIEKYGLDDNFEETATKENLINEAGSLDQFNEQDEIKDDLTLDNERVEAAQKIAQSILEHNFSDEIKAAANEFLNNGKSDYFTFSQQIRDNWKKEKEYEALQNLWNSFNSTDQLDIFDDVPDEPVYNSTEEAKNAQRVKEYWANRAAALGFELEAQNYEWTFIDELNRQAIEIGTDAAKQLAREAISVLQRFSQNTDYARRTSSFAVNSDAERYPDFEEWVTSRTNESYTDFIRNVIVPKLEKMPVFAVRYELEHTNDRERLGDNEGNVGKNEKTKKTAKYTGDRITLSGRKEKVIKNAQGERITEPVAVPATPNVIEETTGLLTDFEATALNLLLSGFVRQDFQPTDSSIIHWRDIFFDRSVPLLEMTRKAIAENRYGIWSDLFSGQLADTLLDKLDYFIARSRSLERQMIRSVGNLIIINYLKPEALKQFFTLNPLEKERYREHFVRIFTQALKDKELVVEPPVWNKLGDKEKKKRIKRVDSILKDLNLVATTNSLLLFESAAKWQELLQNVIQHPNLRKPINEELRNKLNEAIDKRKNAIQGENLREYEDLENNANVDTALKNWLVSEIDPVRTETKFDKLTEQQQREIVQELLGYYNETFETVRRDTTALQQLKYYFKDVPLVMPQPTQEQINLFVPIAEKLIGRNVESMLRNKNSILEDTVPDALDKIMLLDYIEDTRRELSARLRNVLPEGTLIRLGKNGGVSDVAASKQQEKYEENFESNMMDSNKKLFEEDTNAEFNQLMEGNEAAGTALTEVLLQVNYEVLMDFRDIANAALRDEIPIGKAFNTLNKNNTQVGNTALQNEQFWLRRGGAILRNRGLWEETWAEALDYKKNMMNKYYDTLETDMFTACVMRIAQERGTTVDQVIQTPALHKEALVLRTPYWVKEFWDRKMRGRDNNQVFMVWKNLYENQSYRNDPRFQANLEWLNGIFGLGIEETFGYLTLVYTNQYNEAFVSYQKDKYTAIEVNNMAVADQFAYYMSFDDQLFAFVVNKTERQENLSLVSNDLSRAKAMTHDNINAYLYKRLKDIDDKRKPLTVFEHEADNAVIVRAFGRPNIKRNAGDTTNLRAQGRWEDFAYNITSGLQAVKRKNEKYKTTGFYSQEKTTLSLFQDLYSALLTMEVAPDETISNLMPFRENDEKFLKTNGQVGAVVKHSDTLYGQGFVLFTTPSDLPLPPLHYELVWSEDKIPHPIGFNMMRVNEETAELEKIFIDFDGDYNPVDNPIEFEVNQEVINAVFPTKNDLYELSYKGNANHLIANTFALFPKKLKLWRGRMGTNGVTFLDALVQGGKGNSNIYALKREGIRRARIAEKKRQDILLAEENSSYSEISKEGGTFYNSERVRQYWKAIREAGLKNWQEALKQKSNWSSETKKEALLKRRKELEALLAEQNLKYSELSEKEQKEFDKKVNKAGSDKKNDYAISGSSSSSKISFDSYGNAEEKIITLELRLEKAINDLEFEQIEIENNIGVLENDIEKINLRLEKVTNEVNRASLNERLSGLQNELKELKENNAELTSRIEALQKEDTSSEDLNEDEKELLNELEDNRDIIDSFNDEDEENADFARFEDRQLDDYNVDYMFENDTEDRWAEFDYEGWAYLAQTKSANIPTYSGKQNRIKDTYNYQPGDIMPYQVVAKWSPAQQETSDSYLNTLKPSHGLVPQGTNARSFYRGEYKGQPNPVKLINQQFKLNKLLQDTAKKVKQENYEGIYKNLDRFYSFLDILGNYPIEILGDRYEAKSILHTLYPKANTQALVKGLEKFRKSGELKGDTLTIPANDLKRLLEQGIFKDFDKTLGENLDMKQQQIIEDIEDAVRTSFAKKHNQEKVYYIIDEKERAQFYRDRGIKVEPLNIKFNFDDFNDTSDETWLSNLYRRNDFKLYDGFLEGKNTGALRTYQSVEHAYQTWKSGKFDELAYNHLTQKGQHRLKPTARFEVNTKNDFNVHLMIELIKESFLQSPESFKRLQDNNFYLNRELKHNTKDVFSKAFPNALRTALRDLRKIGAPRPIKGREDSIKKGARITNKTTLDNFAGNIENNLSLFLGDNSVDGVIYGENIDYGDIKERISHWDKPKALAYKGDINILKNPNLLKIAVIGTLTPSQDMIANEQKLVRNMVKKGAVIISGLAKGCDKIAHETALACGGKTIAILPSTLKNPYPKEHLALAQEIVKKGGLLITENWMDAYDNKSAVHNLIRRDRLQALFSDAVFLMGSQGIVDKQQDKNADVGSRHALNKANEWGIPRLAFIGTDSQFYNMNREEIANGATAINDESDLNLALDNLIALKGDNSFYIDELEEKTFKRINDIFKQLDEIKHDIWRENHKGWEEAEALALEKGIIRDPLIEGISYLESLSSAQLEAAYEEYHRTHRTKQQEIDKWKGIDTPSYRLPIVPDIKLTREIIKGDPKLKGYAGKLVNEIMPDKYKNYFDNENLDHIFAAIAFVQGKEQKEGIDETIKYLKEYFTKDKFEKNGQLLNQVLMKIFAESILKRFKLDESTAKKQVIEKKEQPSPIKKEQVDVSREEFAATRELVNEINEAAIQEGIEAGYTRDSLLKQHLKDKSFTFGVYFDLGEKLVFDEENEINEARDWTSEKWNKKVRELLSPVYQKDELEKFISDYIEYMSQDKVDNDIGYGDTGHLDLNPTQYMDLLNKIEQNFDKPGVKKLARIVIDSLYNEHLNSDWQVNSDIYINPVVQKAKEKRPANNQSRLFSHLNLDTDSPLNKSKADAVNFISKVLGDSVGVAFRENAWGEKKDVVGEFSETDGKRLITLAMTGDMLSTAYHESFHAFLGTLKDKAPQHYKKLLQLSKQYREPLLAKLKELSPAAHESAMFDDEELATYAYQLTMMGMLPSNALQKKVLGKIQQMLYTVGGLFNQTWRNQVQESADVLEAETQLGMVYRKFNEGAMATSFSQEAFLKQLNTDFNKKRHAQTLNNVMDALGKWGDKLLYSADAVLRRPNIDALNRLADKFYNDVVERSDGSLELGDFTTKIGIERNRWVNEYLKAIGDLEDHQKKAIRKALLYKDADSGRASLKGNKALEEGYDKMRAFFDALYEDLAERGIHSKVMKKTGKKDEDGNDIYETKWIAWKNKKKDGTGVKYRKNYFPFVWSQNAIKANREKFISLLVPEIEDAVNKKLITLNKETGDTAYTHAVYLTDSLLGLNHEQDYFSTVPDNIHGTPYGSATESRYLGFIQNREKFDEFFDQDMDNVVADYVIRQTKRATFQNIFGYNGGELNELMKKAEAEIAHRNGLRTSDELADLNIDPATAAEENAKLQKLMQPYHDAVAAMLGALGQDLAFDSPLRTINAFGVTYQNFRLLTFSLFTSFQDVAGLFIHGGTLQDAFDGFMRGLNQIWHTWRKTKSKDEWVELAADFGIVDPLSYLGSIGELNGTQYMTGKMRGYSNKFFRFIGLEGWNRGLRTQAAIIAERQIKKWQRDGLGDTKAEQMLYRRIFGSLNPKDIQMDGEHLRNNDENRYALRRMVDDMIMAPTAANRPAWASNPRYLLFAQLKTFTYTMHRVMMRGILEQVRLGNVKPAAAAVASIFPLALAGYMVKELALSAIDDDDEDWKFKPNNLAGYIFQRAGVLGVPQMYLEDVFSGDFARMLGPTADQIQGWASIPFAGMQFPLFGWTVSHNHQVGKELVNASPFASLVKRIPGMYSS